MEKRNFKSKISLACGSDNFRPAMEHLCFEDGLIVATDAHILIKQSIKLHGFTDEEIEILNGKFLHRDAFDEIYKYRNVTVTKKGFLCKNKNVTCLIEFSKVEFSYPKWRNVIPTGELHDIDEIGINTHFLKIAGKISLSENKALRFHFYGKTKAIILSSLKSYITLDEEMILIMPAQLA
tara:strand:+ start:10640 stop:11179 length:540 start_codon:yes stop_codon:yes gene_type:complete